MGATLTLNTIELLVGDRRLSLKGHAKYLEGIAGQQCGETPLMRIVRKQAKGATYLDVGANVGLTAVAAAVARPDLRIVAFEPVPSNADLLAQNIRTNLIENCKVVRSAVGKTPGHLTMSDSGPWSVVYAIGTGPLEVPATSLDAFCSEHLPNSKIDLIKIDVEGYEPCVLAGAQATISKWNPVIFMEFNSWCLILGGRNPLAFARAIWEAFSVESDEQGVLHDPVLFVHDNIVRHGSVEDIILRVRSPSALAAIDASGESAEKALRSEIDALRHSTSWRVTAPLRFAKSLLMR